MKTVLYMHGGSGNHGCEALVRTTTKMVKDVSNSDVILWSQSPAEDIKYGVNSLVDNIIATDELNKKSLGFLFTYFKFKFLKKTNALHNRFMKVLFKDSVAISIGGDNYCYPWSAKQGVELDKDIRKYCNKNIFWGCSIEEKDINDDIIEDLKGFDLITARETLSYNCLKKINPNTVLVADPAFTLDKKELPLPNGFVEGNTVGINVSPLINDYVDGENIILDNYVELIKHIIADTDMNVCLIPHVVWSYNDDFKPINTLYGMFKDTGRVIKLEDHNCEELKGYISRCRFFVGARTHATIAAYSTCVPTLVVGYSVKSKGIAKDLFGTDENYVIPVQSMNNQDDLKNAFDYIYKNEKEIKNKLTSIMPEYKEKALIGANEIRKLIG